VDGRSRTFNIANIAGGAMLAIGGVFVGAWPSVTLNVIWVAIGLRAVASPASPVSNGSA
jgi:hypothetical protein